MRHELFVVAFFWEVECEVFVIRRLQISLVEYMHNFLCKKYFGEEFLWGRLFGPGILHYIVNKPTNIAKLKPNKNHASAV